MQGHFTEIAEKEYREFFRGLSPKCLRSWLVDLRKLIGVMLYEKIEVFMDEAADLETMLMEECVFRVTGLDYGSSEEDKLCVPPVLSEASGGEGTPEGVSEAEPAYQ